MKFGVVVFPGSNCDEDLVYTLGDILNQEVVKLWHKDTDIQGCDFIMVPGGFSYGDYLVVPRGTIYQMEFDDENNRLFIIESYSPIRFPKRYQNQFGQLMEHAPFCERDIRRPNDLETFLMYLFIIFVNCCKSPINLLGTKAPSNWAETISELK